ncbi:MAG: NTP transferase domain-containing protein [Bacteroidales bacterium]
MVGKEILFEYSVLILAAGRSVRMQEPKFLLMLPSGRTFLEDIVLSYRNMGLKKIIVVLNSEGVVQFNKKIPHLSSLINLVENCNPDYGRFYSIQRGLSKCSNSSVLIHNIDNPFISEHVVSRLINCKGSYDYVYPQHGHRGGHPLLIDSSLCRLILEEKNFNQNIRNYLEKFNYQGVQVDSPLIHTNINTKEDYTNLFEKLSINP